MYPICFCLQNKLSQKNEALDRRKSKLVSLGLNSVNVYPVTLHIAKTNDGRNILYDGKNK